MDSHKYISSVFKEFWVQSQMLLLILKIKKAIILRITWRPTPKTSAYQVSVQHNCSAMSLATITNL